jgi:hypothetical protein
MGEPFTAVVRFHFFAKNLSNLGNVAGCGAS